MRVVLLTMENASERQLDETYDIVIIGGGTAGCVLANRLSEDSCLRILILEAGIDHNEDPRVKVPGRAGECLGNSGIDWQFSSEPQAGLNDRVISHPRGKLIGGTSAINSHAIVQPSTAWLDAWAEFGNAGWDAETMLPYYDKFQTLLDPVPDVQKQFHLQHASNSKGKNSGPVQATFPAAVDPLSQAWVDTFDQLDHRMNEHSLTGLSSTGGGITPCAVANGERSHAGVAYLEPIRHRRNLIILENVLVERVILEVARPGLVFATGVQYLRHGISHICQAEKEVIVCAGAFQSPQILELSGIGNPKLLGSLGIDVIVPNEYVGENLQDHLNCGPSFEVKEGYATSDDTRNPAYVAQMKAQYEIDKSGPLASGGCYTFGYSSLQMFDSEAEIQELLERIDTIATSADPATAALHLPSQKLQDRFIRSMTIDPNEATATIYMALRQRNLDQPEAKRKALLQPGNFITLIAMLSYPFSRGTVHIKSADPQEKPRIDFQYLTHPLDVETFARHLFAFEKLVTCEPLASTLKPGGRRLPVTFAEKIDTVEKASKMLRQCAGTNYHPACTCPMMSKELGGVVNDRMVVHGTKNLRICDASIFPIIPRGNILSSVYAVAERGADIIKSNLKVNQADR